MKIQTPLPFHISKVDDVEIIWEHYHGEWRCDYKDYHGYFIAYDNWGIIKDDMEMYIPSMPDSYPPPKCLDKIASIMMATIKPTITKQIRSITDDFQITKDQ